MPNGVLQSCIIDFSMPAGQFNSPVVSENGVVPEKRTLVNLMPGTRYEFTMYCFSGRGPGFNDLGVRGSNSVSAEATTILGGK